VTGKRFGRPQLWALLLLSAYTAQALWVVHRAPLRWSEAAYAQAGIDQLAGKLQPRDQGALPVPAVMAAWPVILAHPFAALRSPGILKWLLRLPFVAFGWLLGASIWYVARRLYGNAGGYIALTLYCFSPAVLFPWPGPLLAGSLGIFGTVFVAIATAHTLYAPPEASQMRSRWRRIVLLALAITLALGCGFWAVLLVALGLAFMLYVVPERRGASLASVLSACALVAILLLALFGFRPGALAGAFIHASWLPQRGMLSTEVARAYLTGIARTQSVALLALTAIALLAYLAFSRCRYFGNTAPLLSALVVSALALVMFADVFVGPFPLRATAFVYVFIAGVFADLLESRWRRPFLPLMLVLLAAYVLISIWGVFGTSATVV